MKEVTSELMEVTGEESGRNCEMNGKEFMKETWEKNKRSAVSK